MSIVNGVSVKMPKSFKNTFVEEMLKAFLPYFKGLGFQNVPSRTVRVYNEPKRHYPLGCFERDRSDGSIDVIEFRFEKTGRPNFCINFTNAPKDGANHQYGFEVQENIPAYGVGEFGSGQSRFSLKGSRDTFGIVFWQRKNSNTIKNTIKECFTVFKQIENWFQHRIVGHKIVTIEYFPKGIGIVYGENTLLFFRKVTFGYSNPIGNDPYFTSEVEAKRYLVEILKEQKRFIKFGLYWPWQDIYH